MRREHWIALAFMTLASLVAQWLMERHYWWESIPGFYALFGFVGCVAIIFLSKWFGALLVQKSEGYYDRE